MKRSRFCWIIAALTLFTPEMFGAMLGVGWNFPTDYYGGEDLGGGIFAGEYMATASGWNINPSSYSAGVTTGVSAPGTFQTFGLELQMFKPGTYDARLGSTLASGGQLTAGAAWLYSQFASGSLPTYDFSVLVLQADGRWGDAGDVQSAILALQSNGAVDPYNRFDQMVLDKFGTWDAAKAPSGGAYGVQVVNTWTAGHLGDPSFQGEDFLTIAAAPTPVPESSTKYPAGMVAIGLVLFAGSRIRQRG